MGVCGRAEKQGLVMVLDGMEVVSRQGLVRQFYVSAVMD